MLLCVIDSTDFLIFNWVGRTVSDRIVLSGTNGMRGSGFSSCLALLVFVCIGASIMPFGGGAKRLAFVVFLFLGAGAANAEVLLLRVRDMAAFRCSFCVALAGGDCSFARRLSMWKSERVNEK